MKPYLVAAFVMVAMLLPAFGAQFAVAAAPSSGYAAPAFEPAVTPAPSPSASATDDMAGMSHQDMTGMSHEDMPGMNHASPSVSTPTPSTGMNDQTMPGMDHGSGNAEPEGSTHAHGEGVATPPRPVAALVGGFAAVNGGVMITAAVLRRRDKRHAATSSRPTRPAK
ncbi:MAG: hypothetical protein CVT65_13705 [Actinobacteria bacterium HGW-Actinobacteria-5]|jgi:uncharacterized protein involved in copper resistance|nr:MAG: hypothetical protein CVT65_13705 [Actinobacteria bacterium HGW-Actinobacteria-5]